MPMPNFSDPYLIQMLRSIQLRLTRIEQSFNGIKDSNGITRIRFGATPGTDDYGVIAYDDDGNTRVQLGGLSNGDYGISLADLAGNTVELLPSNDDYVDTTLSTSSSTPVTIAGSPSVTIEIAASGDFEVTCGSYIGVPSNSTGTIYLAINGSEVGSLAAVSSQSAGGAADSACSIRRYGAWAGATLPPNQEYTFTLLYSSSSGTCDFSANYLKIQPI